jgi:hypothetical protein
MKNQWLDEVKRRLVEESSQPSDVRFQRLREQGIINDRGEVTGHLHRWDAFLAITEVKHVNCAEKIAVFRCLKPVFGMPGAAMLDLSRESVLEYLKQGKKIITARWDDRLAMWKEGSEVRLSPKGFIRTDLTDDMGDNVRGLPEFKQLNSGL